MMMEGRLRALIYLFPTWASWSGDRYVKSDRLCSRRLLGSRDWTRRLIDGTPNCGNSVGHHMADMEWVLNDSLVGWGGLRMCVSVFQCLDGQGRLDYGNVLRIFTCSHAKEHNHTGIVSMVCTQSERQLYTCGDTIRLR